MEMTMPEQPDAIRPPWSRSDRAIPRTVLRPLQDFLQTSTSSATLLFVALTVALVWANLGDSYAGFWHTEATLRIGGVDLGHDIRWWVNDGLMTFFFLVVGVEIKRELTTGELRRPRAAALPAIAAIGGMVAPALIFLALVGDGAARRGWAIPMATDIALALGALALAASRAPGNLRPILLTLAIVDDIGAIIVIAVFYSDGGNAQALVAAAVVVASIFLAQRVRIRAMFVYIGLGVALWWCFERAGIHPTIAGVIVGLLTPSQPFQRPAAVSEEARRTAEETLDHPDPPDADADAWLRLATLSIEAVPPLARVEHATLPWSAFVIVPLFALANAEVELSGETLGHALTSRLGLAIIVGLVIGKPLGVTLAGVLAVAGRVGELPSGVDRRDLVGMGAVAGIGFTVALFVAELAFAAHPELLEEAKVAILLGSALALMLGQVVLRTGRARSGR
jgi:NhaA family Na+:H+ antiporter